MTVKAKVAKPVHQVTPTVSIAKTGSELLHADLPAAKPTKTKTESRLPGSALLSPHVGLSLRPPVATGEPRKAPASDNRLSPVPPRSRRNGDRRNPLPLPSPIDPRAPTGLQSGQLEHPAQRGWSRKVAAFENTVRNRGFTHEHEDDSNRIPLAVQGRAEAVSHQTGRRLLGLEGPHAGTTGQGRIRPDLL